MVDNNSTDNLESIVSNLLDKYPELPLRLILAPERKGAAYARNVGVSHARYEVIAFCDGDDVIGENWLAEIAGSLNNDVDAIVGSLFLWDGESNLSDGPQNFKRAIPDIDSEYLIGMPSGNLGIIKSAYMSIGGFDMTFPHGAEDIDFGWRLQEKMI